MCHSQIWCSFEEMVLYHSPQLVEQYNDECIWSLEFKETKYNTHSSMENYQKS